VPVALQDIPETGRHFELQADDSTRALIAEMAELRSLPRLDASFEVTRHGADGLRVLGQVSATVGQICVVSLDPIENEIREDVDLVFLPDAAAGAGAATGHGRPAEIGIADAPEPLLNETVDLGLLAIEFMILGIDPYPRKPGAIFETPRTADETAHPFAALAKLQRGQGGDEG
jgi:hypothetical protein